MTMYSRSPVGPKLNTWYPPTHSSLLQRLTRLGLFHDEHAKFNEQMALQRRTSFMCHSKYSLDHHNILSIMKSRSTVSILVSMLSC